MVEFWVVLEMIFQNSRIIHYFLQDMKEVLMFYTMLLILD